MSTFLGIVIYPHPRYLWLTWFPLFFITFPLWSFRTEGFSARRSWQRCHGIPSGRWLFFESQSILWPRRCQCPSWSFGQSSRGQAVKGEGVWVVQRLSMELGWWCSGYNRFFRKELVYGILIEKCLALTKEWCHSLWQYACCPLVLSSFETCIRDCRIRIFLWSCP